LRKIHSFLIASLFLSVALAGCSTAPKHEAPPPAPPPETITITTDGLFDFDSAVIKPELAAKLDEVASRLEGREYNSVSVVGHTCNIGSEAYNEDLGMRRAQAAADYLGSRGVNRAAMSVSSDGETNPAYSNDTADGRAKNRRVEVAVN
jgi:outer membrane protein OmpA-like peptidoglycan-associated protein